MAIRAFREILIEAPREVVMDSLADVPALPAYSSVHKSAEILDRHPDGRPHHVQVKVRMFGRSDVQLLDYRWGPDWLVWDSEPTSNQAAQHFEFHLTAVNDGAATRMRVDMTVEPIAPVPDFLVKRACDSTLEVAMAGVRRLSLQRKLSHHLD